MTIYKSRYQANKDKKYGQVVVKVDGGYTIMEYSDWQVWKKQK